MGFEIRVIAERQLNGFDGELADLWYRVSAAGGSVGFGTTVDRAEVERAAARVAADVTAGRTPLLTLRDEDGRLLGVVRLEPGSDPVVEHRAMLKLLMIDPGLQGQGWGTRLVDGCVALARELGIEQLYLSCRGRTGLEEYYTKLGWTEVGRYPGGVRVAPGDDRDEVWFFRPVDAPAPRLPPTTSTTTTTTTTTVAATTTTSTSTTTVTTAPVDPVAIELTAGCDGSTGFVDAVVTASVDIVGVQLELRRMLIQSDPLAVETIGDMPAGTTAFAHWSTTGGFTYSVDVLANGAFVGNAVAGMDPCAGTPPPAAPPAPAALPATR